MGLLDGFGSPGGLFANNSLNRQRQEAAYNMAAQQRQTMDYLACQAIAGANTTPLTEGHHPPKKPKTPRQQLQADVDEWLADVTI